MGVLDCAEAGGRYLKVSSLHGWIKVYVSYPARIVHGSGIE